jgi:catechol 2,3-dioxygenase-like lactoylglutathione lyase family enzyme
MFDGIDTVVLPVPDLEPLERLYTGPMGFVVADRSHGADPALQRLWSLPHAPTGSVLLAKPGSAGGWIRLVEVRGLTRASMRIRADRVGPLALDFYVREPDRVESEIESLGFAFTSAAVHYPLPGRGSLVRERILEQPHSGMIHAVVEYRPAATRCVLDSDEVGRVSEVVAVVIVTDRYRQAVSFANEVLGARTYFEGRFDGPAVETLLGLAPGEGFTASLSRGPMSRNARLEFAEAMPASSSTPGRDSMPRAILSCAMDDLDGLARILADGRHGLSTGIIPVCLDGLDQGRLGLRSVYGVDFDFFQRDPATADRSGT